MQILITLDDGRQVLVNTNDGDVPGVRVRFRVSDAWALPLLPAKPHTPNTIFVGEY
jgi:hypothetical protein